MSKWPSPEYDGIDSYLERMSGSDIPKKSKEGPPGSLLCLYDKSDGDNAFSS